jgi:type IV pilus assembly protein PilA
MRKKATNNKKAFTLIEILLVIVILAVMAAIVIIAINPFRQTANVRNTQRQSDVNAIYLATNQYLIDKSMLPSSISTTALEICRTNASNCVGMADLSVLNESSRYLVSLPIDPKSTSTNGTGYFIYKTSADRPVVYAGAAELGQTIVIGGSVSGGGFVMTNPISRWTFDNGSGCNATDSFNGNNGNLGPICSSNSPVWIAGKVNNALFFDGTDDYVTINNTANLNPTEALTLSAWIKWNINPTTGLSWTSIINKNSDNQYRLQHNSSNTAFEFGLRTTGGSKWVVSNTAPVINVWYFVVATYDKQIMKIYVNGALDNTIAHSGSILTSNSAVSIGKRSIINDRFFNGTIDEANIYSSALSPLEIQNLYMAGN